MEDASVIVMSDAEIAEALVATIPGEVPDYDGSYHTGRSAAYAIEKGIILLGTDGDGYYAMPLSINELRAAFDIRRPS